MARALTTMSDAAPSIAPRCAEIAPAVLSMQAEASSLLDAFIKAGACKQDLMTHWPGGVGHDGKGAPVGVRNAELLVGEVYDTWTKLLPKRASVAVRDPTSKYLK